MRSRARAERAVRAVFAPRWIKLSNCKPTGIRDAAHRPDLTWVPRDSLFTSSSVPFRSFPGGGSDGLLLLRAATRPFPPLVARVQLAAFQPTDFTATSFSAASITAVVFTVAAISPCACACAVFSLGSAACGQCAAV